MWHGKYLRQNYLYKIMFEWYREGTLHRDEGPAFIGDHVNTAYWVNGKLHRVGGPAADNIKYGQQWMINGEYHREDGPAIITDKGVQYWLNGKQIPAKNTPEFLKLIKLKEFW